MAFPCRLVCYTLFSVHASFFAASTSPSFHRMVARAWVLIFFTAPFFETVEKVYNFRAAYWFSLPFAYKRKLECEVSPPQGEVAQSARGAGLAQHITACYKHDVMFCAELTTEQSHHYSARWCAVIRLKSIKVVWGKTRVFPHMRHITSVELSSQTVQWTVWEKGA